jgi:hypothetical protein
MNHEAMVRRMIQNFTLLIMNDGTRRTDQAARSHPGKSKKGCATQTQQQDHEAQSTPIFQSGGSKKNRCGHHRRDFRTRMNRPRKDRESAVKWR